MKMWNKAALILAGVLFMGTTVSAQGYPKNIFGIRGGLNVSSMRLKVDGVNISNNRQPKVGWHLGVADQILLTRSIPLYFETGLMFTNKGVRYVQKEKDANYKLVEKENYGVTYLQIPLKLSYHFYLGDFTLQPYLGFHYNLGLWGRYVEKSRLKDYRDSSNSTRNKRVTNVFGNEVNMYRSDVGLSFGIGGLYLDHFYFGLGWEVGFCNMSKALDTRFSNAINFMISTGYNF